jgi:hypothetical protein
MNLVVLEALEFTVNRSLAHRMSPVAALSARDTSRHPAATIVGLGSKRRRADGQRLMKEPTKPVSALRPHRASIPAYLIAIMRAPVSYHICHLYHEIAKVE